MPAWIHDRAQHLLAKNPKMSKSQAFAIATQQSHALGKSPKGYGTGEGRAQAKAKFDKPRKAYVKTPNPRGLETPKLKAREKRAMQVVSYQAMRNSLAKEAGIMAKIFGGAKKARPAAGAVKAQGVAAQMARGRNFGGAAVDPFVAMRSRMKVAYAALTPAGRLRRAQSIGRAPGAMERSTPSIADQAKPKGKGFGSSLPAANQGGKP